MQSILFLCHRLPWPPDKGDKIRSYHVLQRLAEHYRVYMGTFIDDPDDWRHVDRVQDLCAEVCVRPLKPWSRRWRALASLMRNEPLTLGIYRDRAMQRWIESLLAEHKVDLALCYCSSVAPYITAHPLRRVMDFVDMDSDKWRQYAQAHRGPAGMIYRREARKLAAFERTVATQFDASVFVSEAEAGFFRRQLPTAAAAKVHGIPNGVDGVYWDPQRTYANPYQSGERAIVFVGAMDYRANVHAAQWFASEVWPRISDRRPDARFYIVGSKPTAAVRSLAQLAGVSVTGRVEDVRPWLAHAHAVAAPLRIARGIQNKVLEALAMEKVLLATPEAYEGIKDFAGRQGCISTSPEVMATEALLWLDAPEIERVPAARAMVLSHFDWVRNLDIYQSVLCDAHPAATSIDTADIVRSGVGS